MRTVALFVSNGKARQGQNNVYTRSMRKIAFIDNRHLKKDGYPKVDEYWLTEIVRENQGNNGGCFIVKPLEPVKKDDLVPLVHGMYDLRMDEDAIIITPRDQSKLWVLSPEAKRAILRSSPNARALVIDQGGDMWPRRKPPESVIESEARKLLDLISE